MFKVQNATKSFEKTNADFVVDGYFLFRINFQFERASAAANRSTVLETRVLANEHD